MFSLSLDALLLAGVVCCSTIGLESSSEAQLVHVHSHGEKLMRRHFEASREHLELLSSGNLVSKEAGKTAKEHETDYIAGASISTLTTTLSHVSSTAAASLAAPPTKRAGGPSALTTLKRVAMTLKTTAVDGGASEYESLTQRTHEFRQVSDGSASQEEEPPDPGVDIYKSAFKVSGAGLLKFNGIYLPSTFTWSGGCTTLVWDYWNGDVLHLLYSKKTDDTPQIDIWILQERGRDDIFYQGTNLPGQCAPDKASWKSMTNEAGTVPTVVRFNAEDFTTRTTTTAPNSSKIFRPQSYFIVSNSGIPGFNGVYYTAAERAVNQRCERIYAKGAPEATDYTLRYGHPMWYLQSFINGQWQRPFFGQDNGDCAPQNVQWFPTFKGVAVPTVVESVTATTTTRITTTLQMVCPAGYVKYIGELPGADDFDGRGNQNVQPTMEDCAVDCNPRTACQSFMYSPSTKICYCKRTALPSLSDDPSTVFCTKADAAEAATQAEADEAEADAPGKGPTTATKSTAYSMFGRSWLRFGLPLLSVFALV